MARSYRDTKRKKKTVAVYLWADQIDLLKALANNTGVPVAEYIRQGIALALAEHKDVFDEEKILPSDLAE